MGISAETMKALVLESKRARFYGDLYLFGRQSMGMSPTETLDLFSAVSCDPIPPYNNIANLEVDQSTRLAIRTGAKTRISDISFFKMLGIERIHAIDFDPLEGADIVADLNKGIDKDLRHSCDLLIDGSTLDNIFNPTEGLLNASRLLKAGGRAVLTNMGNSSNYFNGIPYTMFNPLWFFDFFVKNKYRHCDVYSVIYTESTREVYRLSHRHAGRQLGTGLVKAIPSLFTMAIVVFAERGEDSTDEEFPIQHAYRPDAEWAEFEAVVGRMVDEDRPPLMVSSSSEFVTEPPRGWLRVHRNGETEDPTRS